MAMDPGSAEYEASIAHLPEATQNILRAQRAQFCSQFPAGECLDPLVGEIQVVSFQTNIGEWNHTITKADGSVDWPKTLEARVKNAPLMYGAGAILGALVLRQALK